MVSIKNFCVEDAPVLMEIANEAFSDEIARGLPRFSVDRFVKFSKRKGLKLFVAELENERVGFLMLTLGAIGEPSQIHFVGVKKEIRGKGIGRKLIEKALETAKKANKDKVKLFTRPWNVPMVRICRCLGFVKEAYFEKEYFSEDLILFSYFS